MPESYLYYTVKYLFFYRCIFHNSCTKRIQLYFFTFFFFLQFKSSLNANMLSLENVDKKEKCRKKEIYHFESSQQERFLCSNVYIAYNNIPKCQCMLLKINKYKDERKIYPNLNLGCYSLKAMLMLWQILVANYLSKGGFFFLNKDFREFQQIIFHFSIDSVDHSSTVCRIWLCCCSKKSVVI